MNDSADSDKARSGSARSGMTPADMLFWGCVILLLTAICISAGIIIAGSGS